MNQNILIKGARVHNLKNITVEIPRYKFTVVTGVSGSGKSTLVYDIIFGEAQRKYLEAINCIDSVFSQRRSSLDIDSISGLSPVISISQKQGIANQNSTVGSIAELNDKIRTIYSVAAKGFCPYCNKEVHKYSSKQIIEIMNNLSNDAFIEIYSPVFRSHNDSLDDFLIKLKHDGFKKIKIDNIVYDITNLITTDLPQPSIMMVFIDSIFNGEEKSSCLGKLERAFMVGNNFISLDVISSNDNDKNYFLNCCDHGIVMDNLKPGFFSFNSIGACKTCNGSGYFLKPTQDLLIKNEDKPLMNGALYSHTYNKTNLEQFIKHFNIDPNQPYKELSEELKKKIFFGLSKDEDIKIKVTCFAEEYFSNVKYKGILSHVENLYNKAIADGNESKNYYAKFFTPDICPDCNGDRLKRQVNWVRFNGENIHELGEMSFSKLYEFFIAVSENYSNDLFLKKTIKEITTQLGIIKRVGLSYLNMNRRADSISGGELQRLRISSQIGSGLTRIIYVLDEPSIGLHAKDTMYCVKNQVKS